jgi:hypothetical protein
MAQNRKRSAVTALADGFVIAINQGSRDVVDFERESHVHVSQDYFNAKWVVGLLVSLENRS